MLAQRSSLDGDFLASVDVDAGRGGAGMIGAAHDVIPQGVLDLARLLAGNLGEGGGSLIDVFQTCSSVDFAISPTDGIDGRELVVAAGMRQDLFDIIKVQRWVGPCCYKGSLATASIRQVPACCIRSD